MAIGSFLSQLAQGLGPLAEQDTAYRNDQHMNKVFAANPQFAQQLYGARNDASVLAMQKDEYRRKLAQQQALKQFAGELGGINPRDPAQRQSALARYGQITGDLEPMFGIGAGSQLPAAIQIANEIAMRRANGDLEGAKLLEQAAKLGEKGTYTDPVTGEVKVIPGYAPAVSTIEGAKADAGNISDMNYDPLTAGLSEKARLEQQLGLGADVEAAKKLATLTAEQQADLNKKSKNAESTIDLVAEAEKYLPKATNGLIGKTITGVAKMSGTSTDASKADARLKVISAALVGNVPRFEGPQGVLDVELYKQAAGDIANPEIPTADRQAALNTIKDLKKKYNKNSTQETPRQRLNRLRAERGQ